MDTIAHIKRYHNIHNAAIPGCDTAKTSLPLMNSDITNLCCHIFQVHYYVSIFVANYFWNSCYTAQLVCSAVTRPFLLQAKGVAVPDYVCICMDTKALHCRYRILIHGIPSLDEDFRYLIMTISLSSSFTQYFKMTNNTTVICIHCYHSLM